MTSLSHPKASLFSGVAPLKSLYLCCEEACFEGGKFQARKSNLSPKELL